MDPQGAIPTAAALRSPDFSVWIRRHLTVTYLAPAASETKWRAEREGGTGLWGMGKEAAEASTTEAQTLKSAVAWAGSSNVKSMIFQDRKLPVCCFRSKKDQM
jgi:hypothetical protein